MNQKLAFVPSLLDTLSIATKNLVPILITVVLYVVTVWIPYINVGTTIAICNLPVELSKGGVINPLSIFDSKYRHQMGEFILLEAIMIPAYLVAFMFCFFPVIVLGLSWSQAVYLLLDKKLNWALCLTESNKMTMGYKFKIFLLYAAVAAAVWILLWLVTTIFDGGFLCGLFVLVIMVAAIMTRVSLDAVIYRELQKSGDEVEVAE